MNLSEMRDLLRTLTGAEDTTVWSDAQVDGLLNRSLAQLAGHLPWPGLDAVATVTVLGGTDQATLPADLAHVRQVRDPDGFEVEPTTLEGLARRRAAGSTGDVRWWAARAGTLHVYGTPTSDTPLSVRYTQAVPALVSGTDAAPLPDRLVEAAVWHASGLLLVAEADDSGRSRTMLEQAAALRDQAVNETFQAQHRQVLRAWSRPAAPRRWWW